MDISYEEIDKKDIPLRRAIPPQQQEHQKSQGPSSMTPESSKTQEHFLRRRMPVMYENTLYDNYIDFWLDNPIDLINEVYILPNSHMTLNQKLNSVVRLSIVAAIGGYTLLNASRKIFYAVLLAMIATIYIYYSMNIAQIFHHPSKIMYEKKMGKFACLLGNNEYVTNDKIAQLSEKSGISPAEIKSVLTPVKEVSPVTKEPAQRSSLLSSSADVDKKLFEIPRCANPKQIIYPDDDYDNNLFLGTTQNLQREFDNQREVLLSYSDRLNSEFEETITDDFYGDAGRKWRDEGSFLVDRDIYHPNNADLYFDRY
jgi:hypothetical protein